MQQRKDHPNPTANIGFICFTPFHYFVYKNIYKHLYNAEFIIGDYYGSLDEKDEQERIFRLSNFLQTQKVHWRYIDHSHEEIKFESYSKYGLLASCLYKGAITEEYNKSKKKVRVLYGNAKDKWNFGPWSAFFDLVLTYGPYSQKNLQIYGNAKMVGNPKFDSWFKSEFDTQETEKLRSQLDKRKKTILFTPTYGVLSAQKDLYFLLNRITKDYNIIVKFHQNTFLFEKDIVGKYKRSQMHIASDIDDILSLFKIADVVISDNSGALFDALLADLPILSIDNVMRNNLNDSPETSLYYDDNNTYLGVATNSDSWDQKIKKKEFSIGFVLKIDDTFMHRSTLKQDNDFIDAIERAYANKKKFYSQRQSLKKKLFLERSDSGKQAAILIEDLLHGKKPKKTLLAQSIIGYIKHITNEQQRMIEVSIREREQFEVVSFYNKIRSLPFLSRVMFIFREFF